MLIEIHIRTFKYFNRRLHKKKKRTSVYHHDAYNRIKSKLDIILQIYNGVGRNRYRIDTNGQNVI